MHKNGFIILWDLKRKERSVQSYTAGTTGLDSASSDDDDEDDLLVGDSVILPKKLVVLQDRGVPHSRCFFLPHEQSVALGGGDNDLLSLTTCFVTASHKNSVLTVWSAFSQQKVAPGELVPPAKLQEIKLGSMDKPDSFVLDVCYGPANNNGPPPASFLLLGSRDTGRLFALHVKSEWSSSSKNDVDSKAVPLCVGIDYMVPFGKSKRDTFDIHFFYCLHHRLFCRGM